MFLRFRSEKLLNFGFADGEFARDVVGDRLEGLEPIRARAVPGHAAPPPLPVCLPRAGIKAGRTDPVITVCLRSSFETHLTAQHLQSDRRKSLFSTSLSTSIKSINMPGHDLDLYFNTALGLAKEAGKVSYTSDIDFAAE